MKRRQDYTCHQDYTDLKFLGSATLRVDPPSDLQIRDAGDGSVRWSASSGVAVRLRWSGCGEVGFYGGLIQIDVFPLCSIWI
ncbi:hypothetical protein YC2023_060256 [Brassica napus]